MEDIEWYNVKRTTGSGSMSSVDRNTARINDLRAKKVIRRLELAEKAEKSPKVGAETVVLDDSTCSEGEHSLVILPINQLRSSVISNSNYYFPDPNMHKIQAYRSSEEVQKNLMYCLLRLSLLYETCCHYHLRMYYIKTMSMNQEKIIFERIHWKSYVK